MEKEILSDKDFAEKVILLNLAKSYDKENPPKVKFF